MPNHTPPDSELLTPDEQLIHHKRWTGEPTDLKTALRNLAKVHNLADDLDIDELEKWDEYFDELVTVIGQLVQANPSLPDSAPDDVLREIVQKHRYEVNGEMVYGKTAYSPDDFAINTIRAAIQSALPEKKPTIEQFGGDDFKYDSGYFDGFNRAIDTMTANLKSKGLL
jgi:hypothetical protein